jgi:hypothetical protein
VVLRKNGIVKLCKVSDDFFNLQLIVVFLSRKLSILFNEVTQVVQKES